MMTSRGLQKLACGGFNDVQTEFVYATVRWFCHHVRTDVKIAYKVNSSSFQVYHTGEGETAKLAKAMIEVASELMDAHSRTFTALKDSYVEKEVDNVASYVCEKLGISYEEAEAE